MSSDTGMVDDVDVIEDIDVEFKDEVRKPKLYNVVFINDDFTPMDFVIAILSQIFHKPYDEAIEITFSVHQHGRGIAGIYSQEIAQQKQYETMEYAKSHGHPLRVELQEVDA